MPHAAESGDEDSVGGEIASDDEREVSGAVADSSLRVGDGCASGLKPHSVCNLELALPYGIGADVHRDLSTHGVDVESGLDGASDREMAGEGKQRVDFSDCATHFDRVDESRGPRQRNRGKDCDDRQNNGQLDDVEPRSSLHY